MVRRTTDILVIGDAREALRALSGPATRLGWRTEMAGSAEAAHDYLERRTPDVVVVDAGLAGFDATAFMGWLGGWRLPCSVIAVAERGGSPSARELLALGAREVLHAPLEGSCLLWAVSNAVEFQRLDRAVQSFRDRNDRNSFGPLVGGSLAMQGVYRILDLALRNPAPVMITGEPGTGKSLVAETLHAAGPENGSRLVVVDCAEDPSFADGAAQLEEADGGTLVLEDVCALSSEGQAALLGILASGRVRVGGGAVDRGAVRLICTSSADPALECRRGRFAEDLLHRLDVLPLVLPPLRSRDGDAVDLARRFFERFGAAEGKRFDPPSASAEDFLLARAWRGNVAELEALIRRVVRGSRGPAVTGAVLRAAASEPALVGAARRPAAMVIKAVASWQTGREQDAGGRLG